MKKLFAYNIIIVACFILTGCAGSIYSQYREIEQMRVIQVMGIDDEDGSVGLSLASAGSKNSSSVPAILSSSGSSISTALQRIRNFSCEDSLFCAHVGHILIGDAAARQGIEHILSYICHSSEIRVDLPVYILINSTAKYAMDGAGNEQKGIAEILQSVHSSLSERGESHVFTAAEIIRSMERNGSALVCALEYAAASESDTEKTTAVYGYSVLKDYSQVQLIHRDYSLGVGLLINKVGISELSVEDMDGNTVTLEVDGGSTSIEPVWSESGELKRLNIQAKVSAAVLEISGRSGDLSNPRYEDQLTAQLEAAASDKLSAVLQLSKKLSADFLDLGSRVELADPRQYRQSVDDFSKLLPELEISISVQGKLSHTYDVKDA